MTPASRPEIVCICGSTRFAEQMRAANLALTLDGAIVVAPGVFTHAGDTVTDEQKAALDALHLHKIDLADRVLVVNPGGYIGESTAREIPRLPSRGPSCPASAQSPTLQRGQLR